MTSPEVKIIATRDGSPTLQTASGITYHSTHGAVQESLHVFIQTGLLPALIQFPEASLTVFEMGFGTGLNAFLTALESTNYQQAIRYVSVEKYPIPESVWRQLTYARNEAEKELFKALHQAPWDIPTRLTPHFELLKLNGNLETINLPEAIQLVYFDAFAPEEVPELWTPAIFRKLFNAMAPGAFLTTYCSKGIVRRTLQSVGFTVEKRPGPPGKREIVRATKPL